MKNLINEELARTAKNLNSFSDYQEGSATSEYNSLVAKFNEEADALVAAFPKNATSEVLDLVKYYKEKYALKLASAINESNRIESMCPSVLICGAGNFPTKKKERQNRARDEFYKKNADLFTQDNYYINKIKSILTNKTIYSDDALAIEKIENKIADLKEHHQKMKDINAYYRKNNTLKGCELLSNYTDAQIEQLDKDILNSWYKKPYAGFELTNNNANIKRLEERVASLKKLKERAEKPSEEKYITVDGLKVEEDATDMRIRLLFEDIPSAEERELLKSWGFRWSPYNKAWQRQLTSNGIRAVREVLEKLKALRG